MEVSVVIPVYNAASYVRQAVESALAQPETAEVILVEDGSTDGSLPICEELAAQNSIVHLYRHPGGENRGAGASRNLGILRSRCEYIGLLDADDFYLPGRFVVARSLFESDPELDGVYEAVAIRIESQSGLERWKAAGRSLPDLYTTRVMVPPEQLFEAMVQGHIGFFHLDGLVVRRSIFDKAGLYDEHLRVVPHEDTAMNYRMAAIGRLAPGRLDEPVAIRSIHDLNSISAPRSKSQLRRGKIMMYAALWRWGQQHPNLPEQRRQALLAMFINQLMSQSRFDWDYLHWLSPLICRLRLMLSVAEYPDLTRTRLFWMRLLPGLDFWLNIHAKMKV